MTLHCICGCRLHSWSQALEHIKASTGYHEVNASGKFEGPDAPCSCCGAPADWREMQELADRYIGLSE
jgi:hypothetical protein